MSAKKKPELLVTAKDLDEVQRLFDSGADALHIGGKEYGLRMPGHFTLEMIGEATKIAHQNQKKIYVLMNALFHNEMLVGLEEYIQRLAQFEVDGIVFGDPAVLMIAKKVAPQIALHWNTETTSTNYQTVNYWAKKGATRAILARELSLQEVIDIKQHVDIEVQVQVHGMTCIFHSKRGLVSSYLDFTGQEQKDTSQDRGLFLREHKRPNEQYPVFEDLHGTHIMSAEDICMIDHIGKLIDAEIDSLKIEGILKSTNYLEKVVQHYRTAIDQYVTGNKVTVSSKDIEAIQPKNRPLGTGFYFKEQYY
ncbi:peptidase U32 family protein [Tepidibacillus fermentans]|uniref:Putative protease n=1 Tax=Tepidibacillus fermentans TaxID=1281767 RepID=A0A4R3KJU6_9BACI|nr:peptidase U32 family protein [Tepidibacillus fermentans]TCS83802.1 putative protease [Tepidibacillus fermentans]